MPTYRRGVSLASRCLHALLLICAAGAATAGQIQPEAVATEGVLTAWFIKDPGKACFDSPNILVRADQPQAFEQAALARLFRKVYAGIRGPFARLRAHPRTLCARVVREYPTHMGGEAAQFHPRKQNCAG